MPSTRSVLGLVSVALAAWFVGCADPTGTRSTSKATSVASARAAVAVTVTSTLPSGAPRDTTLDIEVDGSGFDIGAVANFQRKGAVDPRVRVNRTVYVSATQLMANVTIAATADTGLYER